jgi:hypothetical protein
MVLLKAKDLVGLDPSDVLDTVVLGVCGLLELILEPTGDLALQGGMVDRYAVVDPNHDADALALKAGV